MDLSKLLGVTSNKHAEDKANERGQSIEKVIDLLESLTFVVVQLEDYSNIFRCYRVLKFFCRELNIQAELDEDLASIDSILPKKEYGSPIDSLRLNSFDMALDLKYLIVNNKNHSNEKVVAIHLLNVAIKFKLFEESSLKDLLKCVTPKELKTYHSRKLD